MTSVLEWVDSLPDAHRALVKEFGVWPVHLAMGRLPKWMPMTPEEFRREYLCEFPPRAD